MSQKVIVIKEEVIKNFKILRAYWIEIVYWILSPLLWVLPLIFQGKALVGGLKSVAFEKLTGTSNYLAFVLIGAIISTYMFSSIWGVGNSLRWENYVGTLEFILNAPIHPIFIIIGKLISNTLQSTIFVVSQFLIVMLFLGVKFAFYKLLPILIGLVLLIMGLWGLGVGLSALTLLIKEAGGILHTVEFILYLFSPVRYPTNIHPITNFVSKFIPLTYALYIIRGTLLNIKINFWKNAFYLLVIDIILIPLGFFLFKKIYDNSRKKGTLGHY